MPTAQLRILQTTDLHMHLLGYDYVADAPTDRSGLFNLQPVIDAARAEGPTTLLFDNGDFLQGSPMADLVFEQGLKGSIHPIIQAFNDLGYDAIGLGNHDFDYGLSFLQEAMKHSTAPVVCANARTGPTHYVASPWRVLERDLQCSDGSTETIRVGVISVLPPQTTDWNAHVLGDAVRCDDSLAAARSHLPAIQRAGADLIVLLCHAGISDEPLRQRMENVSLYLAGLPGIDVILTGHTHDVFPSDDFADIAGVDIEQATLAGKPALMPGAFGKMLGQLDLTLTRQEDGWQLTDHQVTLVRIDSAGPGQPAVSGIAEPYARLHDQTLAHLRKPVCTTPRLLSSHFAALGYDDTAPLLAAAMLDAGRAALAETEFADLPCLAATASHRAGGHAGPHNYFAIPPGDIRLGDVAAMVPFNNPMTLMLRWGWQIKVWLEISSRYFLTVSQGSKDQPLVNGQVPSYHFDTLHGLRYRFDLSIPPRLSDDLTRPMRVRDITYNGLPVRDDDRFVVAASSYRAHGGGGFGAITEGDMIHTTQAGLTDILADHLRRHGIPADPVAPCWQLAPLPGTSAWMACSPDAPAHVPDGMVLTPLGRNSKGFQLMSLSL